MKREQNESLNHQRALLRYLESEVRERDPRFDPKVLAYCYVLEPGGIARRIKWHEKEFARRAANLERLLQKELEIHEALHDLLDDPRRTTPDLLRGARVGGRRVGGGYRQLRREPRSLKKVSRVPVRRPEPEYPDTWGSDVCDRNAGCHSHSKLIQAHAATIAQLSDVLADATNTKSPWQELLDVYPFLESKGSILEFLRDEVQLAWKPISVFLVHYGVGKMLPLREGYRGDAEASMREILRKQRQGQQD